MAKLYIVATPIGNLKDITLRALETLANVEVIAAEDTRVVQKLLQHHGITSTLISYHQHNAAERDQQLIERLQQDQDIALVTDAGTPLISDPGATLVQECRSQDIDVVPIPGVSAIITALSASDINVNRFCFEGFLPVKRQARLTRLQQLVTEQRALVIYEAKHRILEVIEDIVEIYDEDRRVLIARELTKAFEQIVSAKPSDMLSMLKTQEIPIKGEFVVIIEAADAMLKAQQEIKLVNQLFAETADYMSHKQAVMLAQKLFDLPKNQLYELAQTYYDA